MDFSETLEQMLAAARKAAGSHWNDIHSYFENEMLIAKQDALRLTLEVMHGSKLPAQAVPGIYMLFVVDKAGVPSVGKQVRLEPETHGDGRAFEHAEHEDGIEAHSRTNDR